MFDRQEKLMRTLWFKWMTRNYEDIYWSDFVGLIKSKLVFLRQSACILENFQ